MAIVSGAAVYIIAVLGAVALFGFADDLEARAARIRTRFAMDRAKISQ